MNTVDATDTKGAIMDSVDTSKASLTGNWKEELIAEYDFHEKEAEQAQADMKTDFALMQLIKKRKDITAKIDKTNLSYVIRMEKARDEQMRIKEEFVKNWDIEDKTFKCDYGMATLRTTKALIVTKKDYLIERLSDILDGLDNACDCIRTFDLTRVRKYKDAGLINDAVAHYDEKKNVVIKRNKQ